MSDSGGWTMDPVLLRPVVTDHVRLQSALRTAAPLDRLLPLALLGHSDRALAEAARLRADPAAGRDPWRLLLLTAEVHLWRYELDLAAGLQTEAWRHALGRERQASTVHQVGRRRLHGGEPDRAASCFELALTLRRGFAGPAELVESEQALAGRRRELDYAAIVLAGGSGRRLGGVDKPGLAVAGWPLVDHVLLAVAGAGRRIVVGPRRIALAEPVFAREDPPGAGPVAAIAAAAERLTDIAAQRLNDIAAQRLTETEAAGRLGFPVVAVLAADLPFIGGALATLREQVSTGGRDAAVLVDTTGRINYLASMWRAPALTAALARVGEPAGRPVRALFDGVDAAHVPDFDAHGADCDTPDDLRRCELRIKQRNPGQLPEALLAWPRLELHSPS